MSHPLKQKKNSWLLGISPLLAISYLVFPFTLRAEDISLSPRNTRQFEMCRKLKLPGCSEVDKVVQSDKATAPTVGKAIDPQAPTTQSSASADAATAQKAGIDQQNKTLAVVNGDIDRTAKLATDKFNNAVELNRQRSGASQNPQDQAKNEADKNLILKLKPLVDKDKEIPISATESANDVDVRNALTTAALAQSKKQELEEKKGEISISLANLTQMAAAGLQAATAMTSLNGSEPTNSTSAAGGSGISAPSDKSQTAKGAKIASSEAETTAETSQLSEQGLTADQKAKLGDAVDAAGKRKKTKSLREALRKKMKEQQLAKGQSADPTDTARLFGGNLESSAGAAGGSVTDSSSVFSAVKEAVATASGDHPSDNLFQPIKTGAGLAGPETEAEVGRILAEVDSNSAAMSGILQADTPSLFERVKPAYANCLKHSCVAGGR